LPKKIADRLLPPPVVRSLRTWLLTIAGYPLTTPRPSGTFSHRGMSPPVLFGNVWRSFPRTFALVR